MQVAQRLYEQGVITYHRTDNPNVPDEAMEDIRTVANALGLNAVDERRTFKAAEGAQEGHPAITPTYWSERSAGEKMTNWPLYKLIWVRALASQLEAAIYDVRTAKLLAVGPGGKALRFTASGKTLCHPGWMKVLKGDDTDEEEDAEADNPVPALTPKQILFGPQRRTAEEENSTTVTLHQGQPDQRNGTARYRSSKYVRLHLEEHHQQRTDRGKEPQTGTGASGRKRSRSSKGSSVSWSWILRGNWSATWTKSPRAKTPTAPSLHVCISAWKRNCLSNVVCQMCQWRQLHAQPQPVALSTVPNAISLSQGVRKRDGGYDFWGCTGYRSNGCKVSFPH